MGQKKGNIDIGLRAFEEVSRIFRNTTIAAKALGCEKRLLYAWKYGATPSGHYLAKLHFCGGDVLYVLTGRRSK